MSISTAPAVLCLSFSSIKPAYSYNLIKGDIRSINFISKIKKSAYKQKNLIIYEYVVHEMLKRQSSNLKRKVYFWFGKNA